MSVQRNSTTQRRSWAWGTAAAATTIIFGVVIAGRLLTPSINAPNPNLDSSVLYLSPVLQFSRVDPESDTCLELAGSQSCLKWTGIKASEQIEWQAQHLDFYIQNQLRRVEATSRQQAREATRAAVEMTRQLEIETKALKAQLEARARAQLEAQARKEAAEMWSFPSYGYVPPTFPYAYNQPSPTFPYAYNQPSPTNPPAYNAPTQPLPIPSDSSAPIIAAIELQHKLRTQQIQEEAARMEAARKHELQNALGQVQVEAKQQLEDLEAEAQRRKDVLLAEAKARLDQARLEVQRLDDVKTEAIDAGIAGGTNSDQHNPPLNPPSVPDILRPMSLLDLASGLEKARFIYNRVTKMWRDVPVTIDLELALASQAAPALPPGLQGVARMGETPVTSEMTIKLIGSAGLLVDPKEAVRQRVSDLAPTQWRWTVTPTRGGTETLSLGVFINVDDKAPYTLKTYSDEIDVQVTNLQLLRDGIVTIDPVWKFSVALATAAAGIIGWMTGFWAWLLAAMGIGEGAPKTKFPSGNEERTEAKPNKRSRSQR